MHHKPLSLYSSSGKWTDKLAACRYVAGAAGALGAVIAGSSIFHHGYLP
jgi:hypothetical protein